MAEKVLKILKRLQKCKHFHFITTFHLSQREFQFQKISRFFCRWIIINNIRRKTHKLDVVLLSYRPCFNCYNFRPNRHVLLDMNRPINDIIPNGWIVSSVHDINLNFDSPRQRWESFVLCDRFQSVGFTLVPASSSTLLLQLS